MSMQSLVGPSIKPPTIGTCDGDGLVAKPKIPMGACDGDGLTAKVGIPAGAMTFNGVKDAFVKKPAKNDASQSMTPSMQAEQSEKNKKRARIISAVILLVGGAMLGYGHRKYIEKGVNNVKGKVAEWASKGKPAELLAKGKGLLDKAKDAIFVKPPTV